jgi:ABC-type phosphate transport system substrate-binding protein
MKLRYLMMCILGVLFAAPASSGEVAVIANPSVPIHQISRTLLVDIYVGDVREWENGEPVVLLDLKPKSSVKEAFYNYLGKSSSRIKSIWMRHMLTGEGDPPEALDNQAEILEWVTATPGAIGYVDRELVTGDVVTLAVIPYGESR